MVSAQPILASTKEFDLLFSLKPSIQHNLSYSSTLLELIAQDPLAISIHEEAGQGRLDTLIQEIDKFRADAWDLSTSRLLLRTSR
jgi:hypothetical protein